MHIYDDARLLFHQISKRPLIDPIGGRFYFIKLNRTINYLIKYQSNKILIDK